MDERVNDTLNAPFSVVIPARFSSTRLPGKPLADIGGVPMIVRVARQALASGAREVVVATDDERVFAAVAQHGHDVMMTRVDHHSGSDRVMEVVSGRGWDSDHIVINVQGDEPLIPPAAIGQVAALLRERPEILVATLCEPINDAQLVFDPNVVKIVCDHRSRARYFSRAPIPWRREDFSNNAIRDQLALAPRTWWRHIGIYGYRVRGLAQFCSLPAGRLEQIESLEQLRLLENGIEVVVGEAVAAVPGGVDTPADLDRVRAQLAGPIR
jgi:3-deoxy-manno-octulosonate cytidylyltransferase (CMP-KDO synthetase)